LGFTERERERRCKGRKEKPSSLAFARLGEENENQYHQNNTVCSFFFFSMNSE
jgi:hypothetical protein